MSIMGAPFLPPNPNAPDACKWLGAFDEARGEHHEHHRGSFPALQTLMLETIAAPTPPSGWSHLTRREASIMSIIGAPFLPSKP